MWLCGSRSRVDGLKRMCDSWIKTVDGEPYTVIRLDDDDPFLEKYLKHQWPPAWFISVGPPTNGVAEKLNWAFRSFPKEKQYGFLADDVVLRTPCWNTTLEMLAGDWQLAYPDDGFQHERLATHPCCGGELLRALGYWALPGIHHNFLDTALFAVAKRLRLAQYAPYVLFEHMHPVADKAKGDATYQRARKLWNADQTTFTKWLGNDFLNDTKRVKNAIEKSKAKV